VLLSLNDSVEEIELLRLFVFNPEADEDRVEDVECDGVIRLVIVK
jgi:hypothetical protein